METITLKNRTSALVALGERLESLSEDEWGEVCRKAYNQNTWFDETSLKAAFEGVCHYLKAESLFPFVENYAIPDLHENPKKVGVIMAGNIPLAGFHDYLIVLLSGHFLYAKASSQDPYLLKFINEQLRAISPVLAGRVEFVEQLKTADAIIATGSNNSSRYFEQYFSRFPNIIRHNRTGMAVLNGTETTASFEALGKDILTYYGLGCRNVSKVFVPEGYDFSPLLLTLAQPAKEALLNHKYSNNYDLNRSVYLVNGEPHFDNGFLMFRETEQLVSPISVVYFQYYSSMEDVIGYIRENEKSLQCVVSEKGWLTDSLPFGMAQKPTIADYADHVDTMEFLLNGISKSPDVQIRR